MSTPPVSAPALRRAAAPDAPALAEVWLRSYTAALPGVRRAHTDDEVRDWFRHVVVPMHETWLAEADDGQVAGLLVLDGPVLEQLYLAPDWRGRGLGDRFVALAKSRSPEGLWLWTFQVNAPARRFYARHGFVETGRTDGAHNEEREPDVRMAWTPSAGMPWS